MWLLVHQGYRSWLFFQLTRENSTVEPQYSMYVLLPICALCVWCYWSFGESVKYFSIFQSNYIKRLRTWPKKSIKTIGFLHFCTLATFTFHCNMKCKCWHKWMNIFLFFTIKNLLCKEKVLRGTSDAKKRTFIVKSVTIKKKNIKLFN